MYAQLINLWSHPNSRALMYNLNQLKNDSNSASFADIELKPGVVVAESNAKLSQLLIGINLVCYLTTYLRTNWTHFTESNH